MNSKVAGIRYVRKTPAASVWLPQNPSRTRPKAASTAIIMVMRTTRSVTWAELR